MPPPDDRGPLDVWAALDPTGLAKRGLSVARQVPGVTLLEQAVLVPVERRVLRELAERVDEVIDRPAPAVPDAPPPPADDTPAELLDRLLRTSMDLTPSESGAQQFTQILQRLVPDEARMLAALADGSSYALMHITVGGMPGMQGPRVLSNVSNVGRAAGVALPSRVPGYVTHLCALGLAEAAPEDTSLDVEYDILLTDAAVMEARKEADAASRFPARILRRTVHITPLGRELWEACRPGEAPAGD